MCVCVWGGGDGTLRGGVTLEWGGELATMLLLANNLT